MADNSIVAGLFGVDPAAYAQEQIAAQTNYNKAMATMDPLAAGKFAMMQGASQLGNVGQGLLGIQDPMMQQATELKSIARGFDLTTPQGLVGYAKAIQNKYPQYAQMAIAQANKLQESAATVYSKTREHLSTLGKMQNERDRLLQAGVPANDPRVIELTNAIKSEGTSKAPQLSLNMKMFDAAAGRRDAFLKEVDPIVKQGNAITQALTLLNQGTPFSQAAFENTVVSAFGGDKQKSVSEIKRLVNTGPLETRIENSVRKFTTGKISEITTEDQKNVLEAIQGGLKRQYNNKQSTIIKSSSKVPELQGQEDFYAPSWESSVGGGAAMGKKAYTVGETFNSAKHGVLKVTKVDAAGNPTEVVDSKGNVGVLQ